MDFNGKVIYDVNPGFETQKSCPKITSDGYVIKDGSLYHFNPSVEDKLIFKFYHIKLKTYYVTTDDK